MYELKDRHGIVLAKGGSQYLYDFVHKHFGGWEDMYIEIAPDRSRGRQNKARATA
jgi:hypothetical protein